MKRIAQVTNLRFAELLAARFNGWVEETTVRGKQLFVVVIEK